MGGGGAYFGNVVPPHPRKDRERERVRVMSWVNFGGKTPVVLQRPILKVLSGGDGVMLLDQSVCF